MKHYELVLAGLALNFFIAGQAFAASSPVDVPNLETALPQAHQKALKANEALRLGQNGYRYLLLREHYDRLGELRSEKRQVQAKIIEAEAEEKAIRADPQVFRTHPTRWVLSSAQAARIVQLTILTDGYKTTLNSIDAEIKEVEQKIREVESPAASTAPAPTTR